jgi:hypothetical protein
MVDEVLFRLHLASLSAYSEKSCRYPEWGWQNLEWYISTGRASTETLQKILRLNKAQLRKLVRVASSSCTEIGVACAKKYLSVE